MITLYLKNGLKITKAGRSLDKIILPSPIICLTCVLPNKKTLVMEGFEKYYFIKENYKVAFGGKGMILDTINLMGKHKNNVYQFSVHRKGKAAQTINEWGKEYRPFKLLPIPTKKGEPKRFEIEFGSPQSTPQHFWKEGVKKLNPRYEII